MRIRHDLGTLTIPSGQSASDELDLSARSLSLMDGFVIYAPGTLSGTVTVAVSEDGTNWRTLQSGGSDVQVPADKAVVIDYAGWSHMRLESDGAEGADRDFQVTGSEI